MFLTKIDSFPLIIYYFKKLHLILNKNLHLLLKKKIIVNPCESRSENYMSYVKKSQFLKKIYKIENLSGGRPPKTHF